jgi:hypothetical protein
MGIEVDDPARIFVSPRCIAETKRVSFRGPGSPLEAARRTPWRTSVLIGATGYESLTLSSARALSSAD